MTYIGSGEWDFTSKKTGADIMTRETRFHVDELPEGDMVPKYLNRQEFGKRLYTLMMQRGWNQSELARQADLPRDSVSTYIRGRSFPTPKSLQALAEALGTTPGDILPTALGKAIGEDVPEIDMRVSPSAPGAAWLKINRLVSLSTAAKIIELVNDDKIGGKE
jgi:transcriptional regulator with XRE-family HTH domain